MCDVLEKREIEYIVIWVFMHQFDTHRFMLIKASN